MELSDFKGKNRRLLHEWQQIESLCHDNPEIKYAVTKWNSHHLPEGYEITYKIRSMCGVENIETLGNSMSFNKPLFHDNFRMNIELPYSFPSVDGAPKFIFMTKDEQGNDIPTPWHPNIRFFGAMKGLVCLNRTNTFTDLSDSIKRVGEYLKYHRYHAELTPPYPEDLTVAKWIREQAEPNGWTNFLK